MGQNQDQNRRARQRERAEAKREAARRAQQRRTLAYTLGGIGLIAVVVLFVFVLMGGDDSQTATAGPSASGEVTVDGAPRDSMLQTGEAVPSFSAPELSGGTVSWSEYEGAPAVLTVWASWCPHCQAELPVLDRVMRDYPAVGFVTITTAIGDPPSPEEYMQENGFTFPTAVDDADGTLGAAFGIQAFPTLYFVNSDGTVAQGMTGEVDEATLRSTIESLS